MKHVIVILANLFASYSFAVGTKPACESQAVHAAEHVYNNNDLMCFGDGKAIDFDASTQSPMSPTKRGNIGIRIVVKNYGPNQIDCTDQVFDVELEPSSCRAEAVKLIGNLND